MKIAITVFSVIGLIIGMLFGHIKNESERNEEYEMIKKPVIYEYGYNEDMTVTLDFDKQTELTFAYPTYENGWKIAAEPNGTLSDAERTYDYLYYDGQTNHKFKIDEGFCIKKDKLESFFEEVLPCLGLNDRESQDFITYWIPQMMKNEYSLISFKTKEYADMVGLEVTPAPDKVIRLYMVWQGADELTELPPQSLSKIERPDNGKLIVEWGGTEIKK